MDINEALAAVQGGKIDEGLAMLGTLAEAPATRIDALGHRAWVLHSLGRLDEALQDLETLAAENPDDLYAAAVRADALRLAGRVPEALAAAAAVLQRDPLHDVALQVLVACRTALGRPPLAIRAGDEGAAALARGLAENQAKFPIPRFTLLHVLREKKRFPSRYDYYEDYLRRHARGKRVIDIGAMWLVHGRFSFFAEECGASEVVAFDALEPSAEFLKEKARRGSRVRYIHGDLMDAAALAQLGTFDVVFCCGVIYHLPDPALGIQRLRSVCRERAMIGTAVIGEGFSKNRAVYYPYMDRASRNWWRYRSRELKLGLDVPYEPAEGYANWFWGMSPSCVAALLHTTGFTLEEIHYRRAFAYFECRVK